MKEGDQQKIISGVLGIGMIFGAWKLYKLNKEAKRLDHNAEIVREYIETKVQEKVDEIFEDIVEHYDD